MRMSDCFGLLALFGLAALASAARATDDWQLIYQDNYDYRQDTSTFNTWFWREDSTGQHEFDVVARHLDCTRKNPCVTLTAPFQPTAVKYVNAEMYNNSCVRQGAGYPAPQPFDRLSANPWSDPLQALIETHCNLPYPYRLSSGASQVAGVPDSWNVTPGANLQSNPLALTQFDQEAEWQAVRDLAFNNPYVIQSKQSLRISMSTRAEGRGGGSRGWGFWNTSLDPEVWQLAWFMEYSKQTGVGAHEIKSAFVAQTVSALPSGDIGICSTTIPNREFDIYDWHDYQIKWSSSAVDYYIDGTHVASHQKVVPHAAMAFHNWVDNRNYFGSQPANFPLMNDKSNYIRAFLVEQKYEQGSGKGSRPPRYNSNCDILHVDADIQLLEFLARLARAYPID